MGKAHNFLKFEKDADEPYESVYNVLNKQGDELGKIMFYPKWKTHIFEPYSDTYFDWRCNQQLSEFQKELDKKYPDGMIN